MAGNPQARAVFAVNAGRPEMIEVNSANAFASLANIAKEAASDYVNKVGDRRNTESNRSRDEDPGV